MTLALGGVGYALYTASFLSYNHNQNSGFVIFAGTMLGICAALLWTAQGTVMMSYPMESQKGRYIGIFWAIFNLGAVIGSAIPIGQNWNSTSGSVNDGTYIAFFVLMVCGFVLAFFLAPPHKIIRDDLTMVEHIRHPSAWYVRLIIFNQIRSEFKGLFQTLKTDYYIVLLFPMFWASNWFYTYQFNDFNQYYFNIRTRAFNNLFYW
jgi:MFS family permease